MTLETQYKYFKLANPESNWTFEEWRNDLGKKLGKAIKELEEKHPELKLGVKSKKD